MARGSGSIARDLWLLAAAWAIAAPLVAAVRAPAADTHHRVKETSDAYVLPPPKIVEVMSLGHRAAVADYLWADVLVEQGLHTREKRRFDNLFYLIETINALDPKFRRPYLIIEALTVFQVNGISQDDLHRARAVLERGVQNLPNDPEILVAAGSFIGLMAPSSYLTDPAEIQQWKLDGAAYLARAAELGDDQRNIGWQALSGFSLLRKAGKNREAVQFLKRALAGTDDEELRTRIKTMLDRMAEADDAFEHDEQRRAFDAFRARQDRFDEIWRREYPLASKTGALVMGPPYDAAYCAGGAHRDDERCAFDWGEWAARVEHAAEEQRDREQVPPGK
ncbi:MAG: hypothetical protein R3F14_08075 [Polyangiaceae bacterium]